MLDRQLYLEMAKQLKYVHGQSRGDVLRSDIENDKMVRVHLSAKVIRQIALLVLEIERIEAFDCGGASA